MHIINLQFVKELDASTSEVSELESKLSAAQRRIQNQAEEQEEAESARAQQGQQLNALAQDMQALQSSLERVKQDRQQVCPCVLPCRALCATTRPSDASPLSAFAVSSHDLLFCRCTELPGLQKQCLRSICISLMSHAAPSALVVLRCTDVS